MSTIANDDVAINSVVMTVIETSDERKKRLAREAVARYRAAHPDRVKANRKKHFKKELARNQARRKDPATWAKLQLVQIRHRAKTLGIEFDLVPDDIVIPEVCPVLGIPIRAGSDAPYNGRPSIDRFDNNRGYVKDNIRVISHRANALKKDATIDEIKRVLLYMEGKL